MKSNDKYNATKYLHLLLKLGCIMLTNILIFFGTGLFLIKKLSLHTSIIIAFTFAGVLSGFYFVYKEIIKLDDKETTQSDH